ncbi:MAG: Wzz/FepE/Etk N-terminal domain-containing protein [Herpetosiphon sp.]
MLLPQYFAVLRKRWWLIALVILSAALSAFVISKLQRPVYRSRASYSAWINRTDSGAYMFVDKTLMSFIHLVKNPDRFEAISQQLQLDVSADTLLANVRMQPQPSDLSITIEADSTNPADPPRIINAVGDALTGVVAEKNRLAEGLDRINIQRESPHQVWKAKPLTRVNTAAGAFLGLILGLLLAFGLEYLDDSLKTSADVEQFVGLTTLIEVPRYIAQPASHNRLGRLRPTTDT